MLISDVRSSATIWLAGGRSAGSAARHASSSVASTGGHAAGGARLAPTSSLRKRMSPSLRAPYGACDMPAAQAGASAAASTPTAVFFEYASQYLHHQHSHNAVVDKSYPTSLLECVLAMLLPYYST